MMDRMDPDGKHGHRSAWLIMRRMLVLLWLAALAPGAAARDAATTYPLAWDSPRPGVGTKAPVETTDGVLLAVNSRHTTDAAELLCFRSNDCGGTWTLAGMIARDPEPRTDIGDAAIMQLRSGEVLCSYRHNHTFGPRQRRDHSIRVAVSRDGGATWEPHSTVASTKGTTAGLWSTFLHERTDGALQCYYDDEVTPWQEGFDRHQWLTMRTWNPAKREWVDPVTVSRAENKDHLSRDGMPSVVEFPDGRLLCVFEGVRVTPPHKSVIRSGTSFDGGRTWSWSTTGRQMVYAPADPLYNALASWVIRHSSGLLICVFSTDEDRATPDTPSTGRLDQDIKAVYSADGGATWSRVPQKIAIEHPCYLAGISELTREVDKRKVILQYSGRSGPATRIGRIVEDNQ